MKTFNVTTKDVPTVIAEFQKRNIAVKKIREKYGIITVEANSADELTNIAGIKSVTENSQVHSLKE